MHKRIENSSRKQNRNTPIRKFFASFLLAASLNCAAGGKAEDGGYSEAAMQQRERVNCSEPTDISRETVQMGGSVFFCDYYFTPLEILLRTFM